MTTIPLWLVFIIQSVVVSASFIAVILVLVLQQQSQFKASVFREIDLLQDTTSYAMTAPIITRERIHTQLATRLQTDTSLHFNYNDTLASQNIQRFLNLSFFMVYQDPIVYSVFQMRLDPYYLDTDPQYEGIRRRMYGVTGLTSDIFIGVTKFPKTLTLAPNPTFPLQFTSTIDAAVDFRGGWYNKLVTPSWGGCAVLYDPVNLNTKYVSVLYHPIIFDNALGAADLTIAYSIDVYYLVGLAAKALQTPSTKLLLVERTTNEIIANTNIGATLFNEADVVPWSFSSFPNQQITALFTAIEAKCDRTKNCTKYAEDNGEDLISMQHMNTGYSFSMTLLQVTPRSHYFAAGERSVMIGIIIGVLAAVLVLVSCMIIWLAIQKPIRQLRESMEYAAVMRNDEISDTSSVLTELNELSVSFMLMNVKLLQARPFMPQSMLYMGEDSNGEAEKSEDDDDDEGNVFAEEVGEEEAPRLLDSQNVSPMETPRNSFTGGDAASHSHQVDTANESVYSVKSKTSKTSQETSTRIRLSSSGGPGMLSPLRLDSILVSKKVAVLIINARGTHKLATSGGATRLEREQTRLVELVEKISRADKGVVDAFQGDHFVVTFNAVRPVAAAGKNGAYVALNIEEGARHEGLDLGRFSMGMSVGKALVGNIGSITLKKNCTIGAVYTHAIGLERLAKRTGYSCVVNARCTNDLEHVVYYKVLGSVQLSDDDQDVAAALMRRIVHSSGNQEWLYQMNGQEDPFGAYNRLMELYIRKGASAAQTEAATMLAGAAASSENNFVGEVAPSKHINNLIAKRLKVEGLSGELAALELHESLFVDYDVR